MSKCSECGKEIDHLFVTEISSATVTLDCDGDLEYDDEGYESEIQFKCPECKRVLFTDEHPAIEFLKGE